MGSALATMTPVALLGEAQTVVTAFSDLLLLVGGFAIGVFVVRFIIAQVKRARG